MLAITAKAPVRMNQDFGKRAKKDAKKVNKAFERLRAERESRREKMSLKIDELIKQMDKLARDDVDRLKSLLVDEEETTIDIDDYVEVDDVVTFKD